MMDWHDDRPNLASALGDDDDLFDEVGRRAGAALRRPAPQEGAAGIARRGARERTTKTVIAGAAVIALAVGGVILLADDGSNTVTTPVATSTTSATVTASTLTSTTAAASTVTSRSSDTVLSLDLSAPVTYHATATGTPSANHQWIEFSPDGSTIVAQLGGAVSLIDAVSGAELGFVDFTPEPDGEPTVVVSADGGKLYDGTVIWDVATGTSVSPAVEGSTFLYSAAFSADGALLAVAPDRSGTVQIVDTSTGDVESTIEVGDAGRSLDVDLSADGTRLLTADGRQSTVWNVATATALVTSLASSSVGAVFSPDGTRMLLMGDQAEGHAIVDVSTGLQVGTTMSALGPGTFSPDGSRIATFGSSAGPPGTGPYTDELTIWDASSGARLSRLVSAAEVGPWFDHSDGFSPDGARILTTQVGDPSKVVVWDTTTGTVVSTLAGHEGKVVAAAYSPDGRTIVTAALDGTIRLWPAP